MQYRMWLRSLLPVALFALVVLLGSVPGTVMAAFAPEVRRQPHKSSARR